jgi:hypothetical protein
MITPLAAAREPAGVTILQSDFPAMGFGNRSHDLQP